VAAPRDKSVKRSLERSEVTEREESYHDSAGIGKCARIDASGIPLVSVSPLRSRLKIESQESMKQGSTSKNLRWLELIVQEYKQNKEDQQGGATR
jgi:hypothetical protein